MPRRKHIKPRLAITFADMLAIVLVWRGTWYVLDRMDLWLFDGSHVSTSIAGVAIGMTILWMTPDRYKDHNGQGH